GQRLGARSADPGQRRIRRGQRHRAGVEWAGPQPSMGQGLRLLGGVALLRLRRRRRVPPTGELHRSLDPGGPVVRGLGRTLGVAAAADLYPHPVDGPGVVPAEPVLLRAPRHTDDPGPSTGWGYRSAAAATPS